VRGRATFAAVSSYKKWRFVFQISKTRGTASAGAVVFASLLSDATTRGWGAGADADAGEGDGAR